MNKNKLFLNYLRTLFGASRIKIKDFLDLKKYYKKEIKKIFEDNNYPENELKKYGFMSLNINFPYESFKLSENFIFENNSHQIKNLSKDNLDIALKSFDRFFRKKCEDYFQEKVILHNVSFIKAISKNSSQLSSDFWHYDLTGNRLKIFIILSISNGGVPTQFISKTHKKERLPAFIFSRLSSKLANKLYKGQIITHKAKDNSCYIFDTNIWHRGCFSDRKDNSKSSRISIQYDVISKSKYEFLKYLNFPKVGFDNNIVY